LGFHRKLKHGFKRCTCRLSFHNSKGVLKGLAQTARIEGGLCEFARTRQQITPVARVCIRVDFQYCLKCCPCRSCFQNSNGVFKTLAQASWTEGGLCEFARAQQQDHSLGFGFSSQIETWFQVLHLSLVFL
jgi:hypothetical protein